MKLLVRMEVLASEVVIVFEVRLAPPFVVVDPSGASPPGLPPGPLVVLAPVEIPSFPLGVGVRTATRWPSPLESISTMILDITRPNLLKNRLVPHACSLTLCSPPL